MNDGNSKPPLWFHLLGFLERLRDRWGHRLSNAAEYLEWMSFHIFGFLSFFLLAPFRWLMRSRLVETTQRARFGLAESTASRFFWIRDALAERCYRMFPPRFFWPFFWLFEQAIGVFEFFAAWYYTRDFKKLLRALPAILLSVPLVTSLILGAQYSPQRKIRYYESARRQALLDDDQDRADFLYTRLIQLGFSDLARVEFESVLALMNNEQVDEALEKLQALAPISEPKFAPAHVYLAAGLLDATFESSDPWRQIRQHAMHALTLEPNHALAKRFLIECQLQDQQYDVAIEGMEALRKVFPDFNAELAHRYRLKGDIATAKKYARGAIQYFESLQLQAAANGKQDETPTETTPTKEPTDKEGLTSQGYLRIAEAFRIVGQADRELELLREAAERYPHSEMNQRALVVRLSGVLHGFDFSNAEQTEQLKQILHADRRHPGALRVLLASLKQNNVSAVKLADELAQDPRSSAKLIKAVGDMYLTAKVMDKAKQTYQLACEKDVRSAFAWNNLGWIWSNSEPIDLQKALECTDRALEALPNANFYETRGQILVKLERWNEAASFLERALNGAIPDRTNAHRSLATIYTALGRSEQAAAHRAAVDP